MTTAREAQLVHDVKLHWGAHPRLRFWRQNVGSAIIKGRYVDFGPPKGCADFVGLIAPQGRFLAIECKSATGGQREAQKKFQKMIESLGGLYLMPRTLADVDEALAKEGIHR
jgi:hypothetical protein